MKSIAAPAGHPLRLPVPVASGAPAFPTPGPQGVTAPARDQMVAGLIQALIADRTVTAPAAVFGMYAVPCLYHPRCTYHVELRARVVTCSCGALTDAVLPTPAQVFTACWHVHLVLWFLTTAACRAQWGRVVPELALAWQDFLDRRSRELAGVRPGDLAYHLLDPAR